MNDFLVMYVERYIVSSIDNETIIQQFNIWNFGEDNYITSCNCIFFSLQCRYFKVIFLFDYVPFKFFNESLKRNHGIAT